MSRPTKRLRREDIAHLLRSAAAITRCSSFAMIGTGAVIARAKTIPLDLMQTREIEIYPLDAQDPEEISTLIDGAIGEGSQFDLSFGYYAHGVGEHTACFPDDWRSRAVELKVSSPPVSCICPEASDIGLAKLCAWREKDQAWLRSATLSGVVDLKAMASRVPLISNPNAPSRAEVRRRIKTLEATVKTLSASA